MGRTLPDFGMPSPARTEPDAHGQAALLLTESLLHALVERKILTSAEAILIIDVACDVKREVAGAAHESRGRMQESLTLLSRMASSFRADGPNTPFEVELN